MTFAQLIKKTGKILDDLGIDYFISGGVAVGIWGQPRHTADIDTIIIVKNSADIKKLIIKLKQNLKGYIDLNQALEAFRRRGEFNVIEKESGIKIDFWIAKNDQYDQERFRQIKKKKVDNQLIKFISPEDLIISKLLWYQRSQSERQLDDVKNIIEGQTDRLNQAYLAQWINKLDLNPEWNKVGG